MHLEIVCVPWQLTNTFLRKSTAVYHTSSQLQTWAFYRACLLCVGSLDSLFGCMRNYLEGCYADCEALRVVLSRFHELVFQNSYDCHTVFHAFHQKLRKKTKNQSPNPIGTRGRNMFLLIESIILYMYVSHL